MAKNTPSAPAAVQATTPVAAPAPVVLYVAVGPKRGLTGTGNGAYSNTGTWQAFATLPGALNPGLPLTAYHAAAKLRNHTSFVGYCVKSRWLVPAAAPAPQGVQASA